MKRILNCLVVTLMACVITPAFGEPADSIAKGVAALKRLEQGNKRFAEGKPLHLNQPPALRRAVANKEIQPFAAVLTCLDSAMPPEIIMDTGLGGITVLRTPAALVNADEAAYLEYAIAAYELPLLVVMGHPDCRLLMDLVNHADLPLSMIRAGDAVITAVETARGEHPDMSETALIAEAARANVWQSIERIFKYSVSIRKRVINGELNVLGAFYEPKTGLIEWMGRIPDERTVLKLYEMPADAQ